MVEVVVVPGVYRCRCFEEECWACIMPSAMMMDGILCDVGWLREVDSKELTHHSRIFQSHNYSCVSLAAYAIGTINPPNVFFLSGNPWKVRENGSKMAKGAR